MKRTTSILLITFLGALLFSQSAMASWWKKANQCRSEPIADLRGSGDFDSNGDGFVTIAEVAVANAESGGALVELVNAVLAADGAVLDTLSDPEARLTVFAPDNEAFAALPAVTDLTATLLYHVIPGHFDPRRVLYLRSAGSALGQDLFIKRGRDNPTINNSEIDCAGVRTDNGLVWFIDSVLQPQF